MSRICHWQKGEANYFADSHLQLLWPTQATRSDRETEDAFEAIDLA